MIGCRLLLAAVTLLIAGCAAGAPAPSTLTAEASPTPDASASATPSESPFASVGASTAPNRCAALGDQAPSSSLELEARPFRDGGYITIRAEAITDWKGEPVGSPFASDELEAPGHLGQFAGGRTLPIDLAVENNQDARFEVIDVDATIDGESMHAVGSGRHVDIEVPDGDATRNLTVTVAWSDACFSYRGTVSATLSTVRLAVVSGCEAELTDESAYTQQHWPSLLHVGGVDVAQWDNYFGGKYGGGESWTDGVWMFDWSAGAPAATGHPDERLAVTDDSADGAITSGHVDLYDAATFDPEGSLDLKGGVDLEIQSDQAFVTLPTATGRFVAHLTTAIEMPCALGSGESVFTFEVLG